MIIHQRHKKPLEHLKHIWHKPGSRLAIGVFALLLVSSVTFVLILAGKTRRGEAADATLTTPVATSTVDLVARHLDGVLVPRGAENFVPRAFMIDNQVDARPHKGISKASVVIESPVEGGITRFLALFDGETQIEEVGPVRSARPYFVDWADGWDAAFFHVGGSGEALEKIQQYVASSRFADVNEMVLAQYFWRSASRPAPHHVFTKDALLDKVFNDRSFATTTAVIAWRFQDAATTTERGDTAQVKIPYGGSYNVVWNYDTEKNNYVRSVSGRAHVEADGTPIETENVIVIKTGAEILDAVGRLRLRTIGSGEAIAYRDGNKYALRWSRSSGEPIRFQTVGGTDFPLTRGRTWIEVTTDDRIFAGLGI